MNKENFISEDMLLLERPNLRKECNISSDDEMSNYLIIYNTFNNLLIQYLIKKYYLSDVDKEMEKHINIFPTLSNDMKDLYQTASNGYLKYFYLRNNIYIERLSQSDINYLYNIYMSGNVVLDDKSSRFIEENYLKVILEKPNEKNISINYGPDNKKYMRPCNAIIIGVRYDQFNKLADYENVFSSFSEAENNLQNLINFLEYKVRREHNIPFYVLKYDDFSVKKNLK